jgi:hypothetical protein
MGQAGVEIKVTPEMVEAGFAVLKMPGIADECLEADKLVIAEIYQAMVQASGSAQDK